MNAEQTNCSTNEKNLSSLSIWYWISKGDSRMTDLANKSTIAYKTIISGLFCAAFQFMHMWNLIIALTFWFVPDKNTAWMVPVWWQPFSQHKHWHADSRLLVRRFVLFTRRCQTNLSGVPSPGQRWDCIKTVKMAAVTGSWHSLHLVMMSKYDIPPFCPKMIISPLKSATSAAAAYEYHSPASRLLCNLHQTLVFAAASLPPFLHLDPPILFVSNVSTFFALLQPQSCYTSSTFHSSFPFTSSVANLSVCMSALSLFCRGIPASSSINCFRIPSAAAALVDSPTSTHSCRQLSLHPLSRSSLRC